MRVTNTFGGAVKLADSPSIDAFARLRVSNPLTVFDSKQLFDNQPLLWDDQQVSGASTASSHSANTASTVISVAGTTAGRRVRQTYMWFNYQPGKSQLVLMTGTFSKSGGGTGIVRCIGQYNDDNGIFFRDNEGTFEAVIRSNYTGSVVEQSVAQSDWNLNPLTDLDLTKSQIIIIDYEWLGVGRVRVGFVNNGLPVYCHEFNHANLNQGVYMSTPNLPLRYEIENDGTGVASSLESICASVSSEGGQDERGTLSFISNEDTTVDCNTAGTTYVLVGLRLKTTHLGITIKPVSQSIINTTNTDFMWKLIFNPTVAGSISFSDKANSAVQEAVGVTANTVTGGEVVAGGYVKSGGSTGTIDLSIDNARLIGSSIAGVRDELYLCATPLSANADISAALVFREL